MTLKSPSSKFAAIRYAWASAAPRDVSVHRKEVYLQIQQENRAASAAPDAASLDALGDALNRQSKVK